MPRVPALMSWSSGKDSAMALQRVQQLPDIEVVGLLTTINESAARVAMHAVREELLELQAQRLNLPLWKINLPWPCPNQAYEELMQDAIHRAETEGIRHIVFGDLFLEDIRAYREKQLQPTRLSPLFPLWGEDTAALARTMCQFGIRAKITCVDPKQLDPAFVGRDFDLDLLQQLPAAVDPCGERGEFHTFVYDSSLYPSPIPVVVGEVVERDGFWFADVHLAEAAAV